MRLDQDRSSAASTLMLIPQNLPIIYKLCQECNAFFTSPGKRIPKSNAWEQNLHILHHILPDSHLEINHCSFINGTTSCNYLPYGSRFTRTVTLQLSSSHPQEQLKICFANKGDKIMAFFNHPYAANKTILFPFTSNIHCRGSFGSDDGSFWLEQVQG